MILDPSAILYLQGGADLYVDNLIYLNLAQFTGQGDIYYNSLNGFVGSDVLDFGESGGSAVPEPATMFLLSLCLVGLARGQEKAKEEKKHIRGLFSERQSQYWLCLFCFLFLFRLMIYFLKYPKNTATV